MSQFEQRGRTHKPGRLDNLDSKRQRFEEAGKFPWKKLALIGTLAVVVLVGGMYGYQAWQKSKQVGGPAVVQGATYPAYELPQVTGIAAEQTAEGISFSLDDLKKNWILGVPYKRSTPLPAAYQDAAGGNVLPLLAYVAPSGRLVVATSFCEPCRSWTFHIEGNQLVCDVCFTRWDLNTLMGVGGGCMDYPPEQVTAEIRGDQIFVPAADLEAWLPRAYGGAGMASQ